MRFSTRYLSAVLFLTLSLPTLLIAQTTSQQTSKTARGSISGRITIKEKGVAGVAVALQKAMGGVPFERLQRAITDQDGYYRITNVAPGNYEVIPSAPAYVMGEARNARSRVILVSDDDNIEGINFAMIRGGVITGRVTDAEGHPLIQQLVTIYRENPQPAQPQRPPRIFQVASAQTDDRGIYRVFGLVAGRYKVGSGRAEDNENGPNTGRSLYTRVFHPDVSEQDKATVIEVSEGSEATDVDILLGHPIQTFTAAGHVVDSDRGTPIANLRFGFQRKTGQRAEFVNASTASNAQGEFVVEGLLPGRYGIYLYPNQNNNEMRAEATSFEIVDQDVSGVVVKLAKGATVTGVVVIDTDNKAVIAKRSELQMRGFIASPNGTAVSQATSPIALDGSFRLAGLASGNLTFTLGSANGPLEPSGFRLTRIERDGTVVNSSFEIKDGEQVTGVRLILMYATATIRGVVTSQNGPLPPGVNISMRLSKPGQTKGLQPPIIDERGHFLIEGIAPGNYELTTMVMTGASPSRSVKQQVSVLEGATVDLTITVELPSPANP